MTKKFLKLVDSNKKKVQNSDCPNYKIYSYQMPTDTCTGRYMNPYYNVGVEIPCCPGLTKVFKDWDNNGNPYYLCGYCGQKY